MSSLLCSLTTSAGEIIDAQKVSVGCLSSLWNKDALVRLKKARFVVTEQQAKQQLAMQLLHCLASPDPQLRDEIAYSAISHWLRDNSFSPDVYLTMFEQLTSVLTAKVNDPYGVYQAFAALVLSEVVRVDRKHPYLSDTQRQKVVTTITQYFTEIEDYRGFDSEFGWRHNIAHSADVMLQLALNPAMNKAQLLQMLAALKRQVVAGNNHFYIYGESKRIAMPVIYLFLRQELTIEQWQTWLEQLSQAKPFDNWQAVYQSQQGLAKLHNTRQFLYALYQLISDSHHKRLQAMMPALEQALKAIG
ncbi:DUF2785 domain-containing protein [Thalassotalea insulae]|uniref:DUF2785 domain-containing protein n=1 Tax=Thalassotalea insulae TaxID=2056778 RepID=UPI0024E08F93|nr:DUF2785 domain-containing protein [Thalassotalea insulae]